MTLTPQPIRPSTPGITLDPPTDRYPSVLHQSNIARFRYYIDLAETEYIHPMTFLLRESFTTNPVATVFIGAFALLAAVPVTVFMSTSFFSIILVLLGVVSTGIILVVAVQSILLITLSLSILSSAALSAIVVALFCTTSWTIAALTPPLRYTKNISFEAGVESVAAAQSLATTVSERTPDWWDAILNTTSMLQEQVTKIPFREWGSQFLKVWHIIPWGRMYSILLASIDTLTTLIRTGFSIAQLVTFSIGLFFRVVHVMIFCVRVLAAASHQVLVALRTSPTQEIDVPLQVVGEDDRGGDEVGTSTGVSPVANLTQTIIKNKGKEMVHEAQADSPKLNDTSAESADRTGYFLVDIKGIRAD
ncbi:hypothetical protein BDZ94DRAFT_1295304 [Collybia nuda]|uniref:Uncharacterized protein n=1 Tax=Collybia nuda TaxID=64659 RepID=A0A9P5YEJ2_9AGAR|nr:hypothetical protein BDZ94DRAFT_1295304 [Collybia nuda]